MRRFERNVTALVFAFSLMIVSARLFGTSSAAVNDLQAKGFDTCDGKPCFLGIIAGVTSPEDAFKLLQKQGREPVLDEINGIILVDKLKVTPLGSRLLIEDSTGTVLPTFGQFVARYGPPCIFERVDRNADAYAVGSFYGMFVNLQENRLDSNSRRIDVNSGIVRLELDSKDECPKCRCIFGKPWFRFTTWRNYERHWAEAR